MRGPKDALIDAAASPAERGSRPPGGKVLQRLVLFHDARGFPGDGVVGLEEEMPQRREEAGTAAIAELYAQTAIALQAGQGASGTQAGAVTSVLAPTPLASGPMWRPLGPTMMANGQTYGDSRVVVSGRVAAIAVDPSNANHVLCGAAGGGVWESRDQGATWAPRTDTMSTLTVGALAFDRSAPHIVYCGTGEGNFYARLGAGILRSNDGGTTWTVRASAPFVGRGFFDLIVDPANGSHLLAATTGGLYESSDGGTTWTQRLSAGTWDVTMHPSGGGAAEVLAACTDGLFQSSDGGRTWVKVALPGAAANWTRLAVDHARSNPAVAYAFGAAGTTAYLYRRNISGTWQAVATPAGLNVGQAWYDWFVAAAPDTDAQVYLGAIEAYGGDLSGTAWTWTTISNKAGDDIHPDQHAIAVDPSNPATIYVGNDGGLFRSPNRGINWVSLNNGLAITEIEYIAQDYGSSHWLLGGTQDNGSVRFTGSSAWDHVADGDGGDCTVNRSIPSTVFHSYYGMGMERSTTTGDFGSFSWIGPNVPNNYQALFYPPMESTGSTIAQAGQSMFLSRNNGTKPGNGRQRWFTFNWPATWHVIWTVMPTTVRPGAPQITCQVQVERASVEYVTYWITVSNLTPDGVSRHGKASFA